MVPTLLVPKHGTNTGGANNVANTGVGGTNNSGTNTGGQAKTNGAHTSVFIRRWRAPSSVDPSAVVCTVPAMVEQCGWCPPIGGWEHFSVWPEIIGLKESIG